MIIVNEKNNLALKVEKRINRIITSLTLTFFLFMKYVSLIWRLLKQNSDLPMKKLSNLMLIIYETSSNLALTLNITVQE